MLQVIERHLLLMVIQFVIFIFLLSWMLNRRNPSPAVVEQHSPTANSIQPLSQLSQNALKSQRNMPKMQQHPTKQAVKNSTKSATKSLLNGKPPSGPVESLTFTNTAKTPPRRRRNSSDGTPVKFNEKVDLGEWRSRDDFALESSTSYENLPIIEPNQVLFLPDMKTIETEKHKSKKKKKNKQKNLSNSTEQLSRSRSSLDSTHSRNNSQDFKPKSKRASSEDFGMTNGLTNGFHDSTESLHDRSGKGKHVNDPSPKAKHHMNWDFVRKSNSNKQFDNSSAGSSTSSVKSFRKK